MKEINLRDFYPWYIEDVMVEVTEEVAEELLAGQRYIKAAVSTATRRTTRWMPRMASSIPPASLTPPRKSLSSAWSGLNISATL